jgi:hypothetical protein
MTYMEWFEAHAKKHEAIMETLTHLNDEEVIDYFVYENMQEKHPDFCPLYADNTKCHDMDELNCYFCACMYFRFSDKGLTKEGNRTRYSLCSIEAKESRDFVSDDAIHLDCSGCLIPHKRSVVKKYFLRDWSEAMKKTIINS